MLNGPLPIPVPGEPENDQEPKPQPFIFNCLQTLFGDINRPRSDLETGEAEGDRAVSIGFVSWVLMAVQSFLATGGKVLFWLPNRSGIRVSRWFGTLLL